MISLKEKVQIAQRLQNYNLLFRTFWDFCDFFYDKKEPTAYVSFDHTNGTPIAIGINEDFWNSLNEESRLFVICHELLHIILNHGPRFIKYFGEHQKEVNYASDIVINHMLCNHFGFNRAELSEFLSKKGCWVDTVFPKEKVPDDKNTEFYLEKLLKQPKEQNTDDLGFDKHKILDEEQIEAIAKQIDEFISENGLDKGFMELPGGVREILENEDSKRFAGLGSGSFVAIKKLKVNKKKKWESVVKKWESKFKVEDRTTVERWDRINPRFYDLLSQNKSIKLPTSNILYSESEEKNKLDVFFFLDVSGSCYDLKDRFFQAAKSLDPKKFNIRLFSFDDAVQELDINKWEVYGGGGTSFSVIEESIQQIKKRERLKKYPYVWLITDGYGDNVTPEYPKKWFWFLSENYKQYIPNHCNVFLLKDYE